MTFNRLYSIYCALFGDQFYTFGWSNEDALAYFERDDYMATCLIDHMRSCRGQGYRDRYAVVTGRRHIAGKTVIPEAYAVTGDAGSYYAGDRVIDVFSLASLDRMYDVGREEAMHNLMWNRLIESLARAVYLPAYILAVFLAVAAVVVLAALAAMTVLKINRHL